MKKLFYIAALFILLTAGFSSCTLEMSENGHLDGFWNLKRIDTLSTMRSGDVEKERIYWSVQFNMIDVRFIDGRVKECVMKFEKSNDTLSINTPCYYYHTQGDSLITDVDALRPYGINSLDEKFKIEHLSSGHMTLKSEKLRLYFKKL